MKRKAICILLAIVMVIALLPAGALAAFTDAAGHWASDAIDRWSGHEIVEGYTDGSFMPENSITRAETATLLTRLLFLQDKTDKAFKDVSAVDWHYDYISKCSAAGILKGDNGYMYPDNAITREDAVVMIGRALGVEESASGAEKFTDAACISAYAKGYIGAFASKGYINGYPDGNFNPGGSITRAEIVTILDNMIAYYLDEPGSYTLTGDKIAIVNSCDVNLNKTAFTGKIIETPIAKYDGKTVAAAETGTYVGKADASGIVSYKGIKFAQAERWQVAELPEENNDIVEAYEFGPACTQGDLGWGTLLDGGTSEDCLNLNIYTNSNYDNAKKAVMVWVYGGANQVGSNIGYIGEKYDGTSLVTENPDVIFVAINYRAGAFGTLDLSSLEGYDEETYKYSNNLARLDIQKALEWVNGNIAAFGGDQDNVTVFGYSSGSANTTSLLLMESAHPYFDKVIGESSVSIDNNFGFITLDDAAEAAEVFFESTGVDSIEEALALSSEEVLAGSTAVTEMNFSELTQFGTYTNSDAKIFSPVCDGIVIPLDPDQAYLDGIARDKPIMVGTTYGEYDPNMARAGISEDMAACRQYVLDRNLNKLTGKDALIDSYVSNYTSERSGFNAYRDLMTDMYQRVPVALLATVQSLYNDVYLYNYNWMPEGSTNRAPHGSEVLTIFDQNDAVPENLQLAMRKAWVNFALYGDPNNEHLQTEWKPYDYDNRYTMMLEEKCRLVNGLRRDDFDLLMPLFDLFGDIDALMSDKAAIVKAKTGTYVGTHDSENGVVSYKGVKYANSERWQRPTLVADSSAYRLSTQFGYAPMQNLDNGWGTLAVNGISEECLNLNIYTSDDGKTNKPVMVWFYGGAQQAGCNVGYEGEEYDGTNLISENSDIIIVTPNYRTGFWGSVDLSGLEGYSDEYKYTNNLARLDLLESLKWVQENIAFFGGDPNNVTIFGQSAGSNNITCLMLMEEAQGYFNKAICESSFALDISLTKLEDARTVSDVYLEILGVSTLEEALQKSEAELLEAQMALVDRGEASADGSSAISTIESKMLGPVVDNVVIKNDYWETFMSGEYLKDVKVMLGTNEGEYDQQFRRWSDEKDWDNALDFSISQNWGKLSDRGWNAENAQLYIDEYLSHYTSERTLFDAYRDLKADLYLRTGAVSYANVLSQYTDTYLYYINYREEGSSSRAYHGLEIPMIYNNGSPADAKTTKTFQQAWLNFARSGDPNCAELDTTWTKYNTSTNSTMLLGKTQKMVNGYHQEDMDTLLPMLIEYRRYPQFAALCGEPNVKVSTVGQYVGYSQAKYDTYGYERHSQYVTMSDGVEIAVDYYIPTIDGVAATEPLPVVLNITPYDRTSYSNPRWGESQYAQDGLDPGAWTSDLYFFHLLRYGYIVALADVRGMGASYGTRVTTNSRLEARDGAEVIDWLGEQSFCNGKVGTIGYSYTGQTQLEAISMKPEHLAASFVGMTDYDKYDGWIRGGIPRAFGTNPDVIWGNTPEEINATIADIVNSTVPVDSDPNKVKLAEAVREHMGSLSQIQIFKTMPWRNSYLAEAGIEIWNEVSASRYKDDINDSGVAIYCVGGNYDVFRRDTITMYENLTTPKKMLFGSWYHMDEKEDIPWHVEQLRWFDYWLKGIDNGVTDEDPIAIKVSNYNFETGNHQGVDTGDLRFYTEWPIEAGTRDTVYLSSNNKLSNTNDKTATTQPYNSAYGIATSCETALTTTTNGDGVDQLGLVFTGEKLTDDYEIIGHPMAYLTFSLEDPGWMTDNYDIDMFITLSDYDPETGLAFQISDGHLRSSLRATGECSYDFLGLPWHPASEGSNEYIELGKEYSLEIDLMPTAYTVKEGHCLRVTVSNSLNRMYYLGRNEYEANANVETPDINVYFGGNYDTRIVLPNIYE